MTTSKGFMSLSSGSPYLSENDLPAPQYIPQPVQPVQVVQPVPQYYAMQAYAVTPQPPQQKNYVFLPLKLDPKKAGDEPGVMFFAVRNNMIDHFAKILNDAGVAWVDRNTGKDNNGAQVLQPVNLTDEYYKEVNKRSHDD